MFNNKIHSSNIENNYKAIFGVLNVTQKFSLIYVKQCMWYSLCQNLAAIPVFESIWEGGGLNSNTLWYEK